MNKKDFVNQITDAIKDTDSQAIFVDDLKNSELTTVTLPKWKTVKIIEAMLDQQAKITEQIQELSNLQNRLIVLNTMVDGIQERIASELMETNTMLSIFMGNVDEFNDFDAAMVDDLAKKAGE